ncbi:hypothetical protein [Pseudomonas sp. BNK-43-a]|uniref:hypothetical protein n=1 Tax=unclassified Pseudomonas TaxID=196821 RepID=UPI0039BF7C12
MDVLPVATVEKFVRAGDEKRLFRSLKTEWVPSMGYMSAAQAQQDIGRFLMQRYNWERPHQYAVHDMISLPSMIE